MKKSPACSRAPARQTRRREEASCYARNKKKKKEKERERSLVFALDRWTPRGTKGTTDGGEREGRRGRDGRRRGKEGDRRGQTGGWEGEKRKKIRR